MAVNNPARWSLGWVWGGGWGWQAVCFPTHTFIFGSATSSSCNNININQEQNETTGHRKELRPPKLFSLGFLFIIHIKTASSYLHYIEHRVCEVKIQGHNGLSNDEKATWLQLLCNTLAPWRQHLTSANPKSEQRGGVGFYENLNFCFF